MTDHSAVQQPIVIVGGGMVGLSQALLLAQKAIPVILLEAVAYPTSFVNELKQNALQQRPYKGSFDARNTALSRRTVEIYKELGIWNELSQHATPIYQVHISEEKGFGKAYLDHKAERVESFGYVIENAWFGQVLLRLVLQNNNITLIDNATVTAINRTNNEAIVQYIKNQDEINHDLNSSKLKADKPQTHQIITPLVIAADGKESSIRQMAGIGNDTKHYQQVALVTTIQTSKPHQHIAYERFTTNGPLAVLPLPDPYRRSIVWTIKQGTEQQWMGDTHDQDFIETIHHSFAHKIGRVERVATRYSYPLSQVLAHQQVLSRLVLMGNAAHTLHPVAGQGFNLCMRDAYALTQTIQQNKAQLGDVGDITGLKQYEKNRLIDQKRVIFFCDSVVRGFSNNNPILKLSRNLGLTLFETVPGIKPLIANFAMGLKF